MADINEEIADYQEEEDQGDYVEEEYPAEGEEKEDLSALGPEEMEKRVKQMEEELNQLSSMQEQVSGQMSTAADKIDESSIYVGQVDYQATAEELQAHFAPCGTINRVTIICDKITGHPKGFAYVEFAEKDSVEKALKLDDSTFKGRQLKVLPKRHNVPLGRGAGRGGRGGRLGPVYGGRGSFRAGGRGGFYAAARGYGRAGPRGGRGRGRTYGGYYNSYY
eukprot:gene6603-7296_t